MANDIALRDVTDDDLSILFKQRLDPDASYMAASTPKDPTDRDALMAHWARIRADDTVTIQVILVDGRVAGSVLRFEDFGQPEVGYWLGREFWGKGIATQALAAFLAYQTARPIYAHVAKDNDASLRVLQKCGFVISGEDREFANARGQEIEEFMLTLAADASNVKES
jgi:RimJ/RimL family protein N-acetyltransferase